YWWVFPNFMLNAYAGVMDTNLVLPLGPDRCKVIFDYYFAAGTAPDFIDQSVAVAHQVQIEDVGICEEVQRGLNSRSYTVGRFSRRARGGGFPLPPPPGGVPGGLPPPARLYCQHVAEPRRNQATSRRREGRGRARRRPPARRVPRAAAPGHPP